MINLKTVAPATEGISSKRIEGLPELNNAHFDVLSAQDDETNNVIVLLLAFVARHLE